MAGGHRLISLSFPTCPVLCRFPKWTSGMKRTGWESRSAIVLKKVISLFFCRGSALNFPSAARRITKQHGYERRQVKCDLAPNQKGLSYSQLLHEAWDAWPLPFFLFCFLSSSRIFLSAPWCKKDNPQILSKEEPLWASYPAMPGPTATDTSEMLKQRLVILLQINLSRLLGTCQLRINHLCPKLRLAQPAAHTAGDSKRNISTCWLGGDGIDDSGSVQSIAEPLPPQFAQRASWAQCLCNGWSAQAKYFACILT